MRRVEGKSSPISTTVAFAAAGLGVAVVSAWYRKYARKCKAISSTQDDGEAAVPLLALESGQTMFENVASISTLTWYKGDLETTVDRDAIKDRVVEILKANPWLCGRFEKRGINGTVCLVYQEGEAGEEGVMEMVDKIFTIVSSSSSFATSEISRETPYEKLATVLKPYLVGRGIDLLRFPSKPFLRISLIPDQAKPKERFALVFSLAHCVGDGYTFYTLHNMLDNNRPILTLNPKRKVHIIEMIEQALGGPMYSSALSNPPVGFILRFLKAMFVSSVFGPKTEVRLFWIDEQWIQREKAAAQKELLISEGYASTNDVVTARFFECTQVDEGIMALNFRGKIDDCHEKDAGNYFNYLVCRPADYSTVHIRRAVQKIKQQIPLKRETKPLITWEHLTSSSLYGATSNWSTFCQPVALPGCDEEFLHVPVLPTDSISCPATFVTGLFLFRPGSSRRVAAMFAGHPKALKALEASGMMGGDVYSTGWVGR